MSMTDKEQPIRILHLSDIHFPGRQGLGRRPRAARALARFVRAEVEAGLVPDLVVISGDLARQVAERSPVGAPMDEIGAHGRQ